MNNPLIDEFIAQLLYKYNLPCMYADKKRRTFKLMRPLLLYAIFWRTSIAHKKTVIRAYITVIFASSTW